MNTRFLSLVASSALVITLAACNTQAKMQAEGEAYIRENISVLSPEDATMGGSFTVTGVEWVDDNTARVTYEDGHMQFIGTTDISADDDGVVVAGEIILTSGGSSSSMNSSAMTASSSMSSSGMTSSGMTSSRSSSLGSTSSVSSSHEMSSMSSSSSSDRGTTGRLEGEFCGGIAAFQCAAGLTCQYDGTYPDAGGICVR